MPAHDPALLEWRSEFPILASTTYMNSNSLGAMPRGVYDEMKAFADLWATRGVRAWHEGWIDMVGEVANIYADVMNAPHGSVSMHQNVAIAQWIILSCFDFKGPRNKIVYTGMNFPSVMYIYEEQRRNGAEIVTVPSEDGIGIDLERLLNAIDDRTLLVPVSHVLFRSAYVQNARAIIEKAHAVGAKVILDTYQSLGCVPVDVKTLDPDFVVGGSVKWICGGPGAGYLYVRPELARTLEPACTGWFAHKKPFEFVPGKIDWAEPAHRFDNGTPHIPALYACRSGISIIREIGVERIRRNSLALTDRIIDRAEAKGFKLTVPRDHEHRGGTVAFDLPHAKQVAAEMLARDFVIDWRPQAGIRVSPHFYSSPEECDRVVDVIEEILETKAYEKHGEDLY
ncbi:MAG: aminotransferase class V-fold PLP-dependent enzyme [Planctomycetes bacterium]|nr:aminotransferase class V-fold PLP-dependent enzyme [Planctomycetota bacterium]